MLGVVVQRGALDARVGAAIQISLRGRSERRALAVGDVQTGADINADHGVKGIGLALLRKGLDVRLAVGAAVLDDPRLALFAVADPSALADGHLNRSSLLLAVPEFPDICGSIKPT